VINRLFFESKTRKQRILFKFATPQNVLKIKFYKFQVSTSEVHKKNAPKGVLIFFRIFGDFRQKSAN